MKFNIGTYSDDLVDLNGERYDEPPESGVLFTLPSGEQVKVIMDYESGWVTQLTLPDGTTHELILPYGDEEEA